MVTLPHPWSLNKEKHLKAASQLLQHVSWLRTEGEGSILSRNRSRPGTEPQSLLLCLAEELLQTFFRPQVLGANLGFLLKRQPEVRGQPGCRQLGSDGSSDGSLKKLPFTCRTVQSRSVSTNTICLNQGLLREQCSAASPYRWVGPASRNVLGAASPPRT